MKLDSKYYDKIRVKPSPEQVQRDKVPPCDWPGCTMPGPHRAPKGTDGQFYRYCLAHVQEFNKSYDFFRGMKDGDIDAWMKAAQTGHRPTWKLGQNSATAQSMRARRDPHGIFGPNGKDAALPKRSLGNAELKALNTMGLDETATPDSAKKQYKKLVKRLHPDANGGSRANEETLQRVIQAFDYLRSTGFC